MYSDTPTIQCFDLFHKCVMSSCVFPRSLLRHLLNLPSSTSKEGVDLFPQQSQKLHFSRRFINALSQDPKKSSTKGTLWWHSEVSKFSPSKKKLKMRSHFRFTPLCITWYLFVTQGKDCGTKLSQMDTWRLRWAKTTKRRVSHLQKHWIVMVKA